jgi:hypothetical protein
MSFADFSTPDTAVKDIRRIAQLTNELGKECHSIQVISELSQHYQGFAHRMASLVESMLIMCDAYPNEFQGLEQLFSLESLPIGLGCVEKRSVHQQC